MDIGFKGLHPLTSLIFYIFAFAASLSWSSPILLALCFICAAAYGFKLQGKRLLPYIFKFILPLILLVTIFNAVFSHYGVTVLFTMKNGNSFTFEALLYGFITGLRIGSMLLWLESFNEIITGEKIIFLFGKLSPRLALIISMVLRFIPMIRLQSDSIIRSEKALGISQDKIFIKKIKSAARRLSILVSWTLERGIDTASSMSARGYALKGRTSYNNYSFVLFDLIVGLLTLSAIILSFVFASNLQGSYNPVIILPRLSAFNIALSLFLIFVLLTPLIIDLREEKLWSASN